MTRKPRIASNSATHRLAHARCPSLALRVILVGGCACPFNAFPLPATVFLLELRPRCTGSLVHRAAPGKVARRLARGIWRGGLAPFSEAGRLFAYASCSSVAVARAVRSTRRGGRDHLAGVESPTGCQQMRSKAARHANRRFAPGMTALGGRGDLHRAGDGLAGYCDRQHCAARHRRRSSCQPGRCGLGGQCLPDRAGRDAAAARRARRNRRPPAHLSRRSVAVHAGLAGLRLRLVAG